VRLLAHAAKAGRVLKDDVRLVIAQFGRQDIFFHAGSVAYSALLAGVPFLLLLASATGYLLGTAPVASNETIGQFLGQLLPERTAAAAVPIVRGVLEDVEAKRGALGLVGAPLFMWFSTRFFGALRSSLSSVFDVERGRSLIRGKLFDFMYVAIGTILVTIYLGLFAYIELDHVISAAFTALGFQRNAISLAEFFVGRLIATGFLALMFTGLYKFLPNRKVNWSSAVWGGAWGAVLFEIMRSVIFEFVTRAMNPASLYSGTLAAIVVVVFWAYYAAVVFLIGGMVARVHEVRRRRRVAAAVLAPEPVQS
jgi:membrane protein